MSDMYDEVVLQERMAAKFLNFYQLALKAQIDPKTAKKIVTTGKGNPETVKKVIKALGLSVNRAIKKIA